MTKRKKKNVWLSVDWDFFQEERPEWDWSHRENALYMGVAWVFRAFYLGEDIRGTTSPNKHFPIAEGFWELLKGQKAFECLGIANTHAAALPHFHHIAKMDGTPHEIWNFDAHHDLGYNSIETLRKWAKEGVAEAGSWLYVLMKQHKKLKSRIIYPTWKDVSLEPRVWTEDKDVKKRVSIELASSFDFDQDVNITGIFIAKSEAWSPPWNDGYFEQFIESAVEKYEVDLEMYEERDITVPREFNFDEANKYNEQVNSIIMGNVSSRDVLRSEFSSREKRESTSGAEHKREAVHRGT